MALGCYEALRELDLRVPDDVAVMGYDDREIARHIHPPLTTVLLPHFEMGVAAAELGLSRVGLRAKLDRKADALDAFASAFFQLIRALPEDKKANP